MIQKNADRAPSAALSWQRARTPEGRKNFLRLMDQWDHLAKELDHAHARLVALKENHYRRLPGFPYD